MQSVVATVCIFNSELKFHIELPQWIAGVSPLATNVTLSRPYLDAGTFSSFLAYSTALYWQSAITFICLFLKIAMYVFIGIPISDYNEWLIINS